MTPRVFVVQNQTRRDSAGNFVPKYNISHAEPYGQLIELLTPTAAPFHPESILRELRHKLRDFNDADHLMCIGNPLLLSWAFTIAAAANKGNVKALQWSGVRSEYMPVQVWGII